MSDYKSICDKCGGGNYSETQKKCSRSYQRCKTCGTCQHVKTLDAFEACPGKLRPVDPSDLAPQFTPYLNDYSRRLEVRTTYGETKRGYIGKTTGWKPIYLLMARRDSISSSETLGHGDTIVRVIKMKP